MLQFHKDGWMHRAVWGDYDAIQFGKPGTTEKVNMGAVPDAGKWTRLEVEAAKIGLKPGDLITGLAYTTFGGTVYWDKAGVTGRKDPVADPNAFATRLWEKKHDGQNTPELPADINKSPPRPPVAEDPQRPLRNKTTSRLFLLVNVLASATRHQCVRSAQSIANSPTCGKKDRDDFGSVRSRHAHHGRICPQSRATAFIMIRGQYDKPGDQGLSQRARRIPAVCR